GASPEALRELERSSRAGGPDNMPGLTDIRLTSTQMIALRYVDESGYLVAPWDIPGAGLLMGASAPLMERSAPYNLLIELARGKVNQVRNQLAEWRAIGLQVSPALQQAVQEMTHSFGRAATAGSPDANSTLAAEALPQAYAAARLLVQNYVEQV